MPTLTRDSKHAGTNISSGERNESEQVPTGDRRADPRTPFTAGVTAIEPGSQTQIDSHTSDLSQKGCFVDTMNPLPAGTEIHLRLTKNGKSFHTKARVIYCQVGVGMGLLFTDIAPAQRSVLERWFAELRGDLVADAFLDEQADRPSHHVGSSDERLILEDLVLLLAQKHLLTADESEAILRRLNN